jgi:hypothetical protein
MASLAFFLVGPTLVRAAPPTEEEKKKISRQLQEALDKAKAGKTATPAPAAKTNAAAPAGAPRDSKFDAWDADKDGFVSRGEYKSGGGHVGNFQNLDSNGDGKLSRDEFKSR